jgi:hypothetical protein
MHVESQSCKNEPALTPDDFVPSDVDKAFIKSIMDDLALHGIWAYKTIPLVWQKTDVNTLSLVASYNEDIIPAVQSTIERTRKTLEAAGYIFIDARPKT